jgi:hypothetical protein
MGITEVITAPCSHAGYDEQAGKEERFEELGRGVAKLELLDEGYANASDEDVKSRMVSLKATVELQFSRAKCIATDDPRFKEK